MNFLTLMLKSKEAHNKRKSLLSKYLCYVSCLNINFIVCIKAYHLTSIPLIPFKPL